MQKIFRSTFARFHRARMRSLFTDQPTPANGSGSFSARRGHSGQARVGTDSAPRVKKKKTPAARQPPKRANCYSPNLVKKNFIPTSRPPHPRPPLSPLGQHGMRNAPPAAGRMRAGCLPRRLVKRRKKGAPAANREYPIFLDKLAYLFI
jgi:hypothetical protein